MKIRGKWTYLYRAVDREGQTVDFRLSANRVVKAAKAFFRKALATQGRTPVSITLDGYAASHRAVRGARLQACGNRHQLQRFFGVELPPDPGTEALPPGHLNEFALKDVS